jgi:hypothetical protein
LLAKSEGPIAKSTKPNAATAPALTSQKGLTFVRLEAARA